MKLIKLLTMALTISLLIFNSHSSASSITYRATDDLSLQTDTFFGMTIQTVDNDGWMYARATQTPYSTMGETVHLKFDLSNDINNTAINFNNINAYSLKLTMKIDPVLTWVGYNTHPSIKVFHSPVTNWSELNYDPLKANPIMPNAPRGISYTLISEGPVYEANNYWSWNLNLSSISDTIGSQDKLSLALAYDFEEPYNGDMIYTSFYSKSSDNGTAILELTPSPVPEPSTLLLSACSLLGLTGIRKKNKNFKV